MNREETASQLPPPLFAAAAARTYCELTGGGNRPQAHWQAIVTALEGMGVVELAERQLRVERMRHQDGATFNPFDNPESRESAWALDMIPLPLTAAEWATIEAGVAQRARLLEAVLADVYGPQQLLRDGLLPPELLFANPAFLHPCHGLRPAGDRFLPCYAVDLYRAADGSFRVLRDFGGHPTGLGYALENRIVISRVFATLFQNTRLHRLAPFFHTLHQGLVGRANRQWQEPTIVLLSPGPEQSLYFEHALLSRYLGYPLVESQDLTVRNGRVYLKKLAGLEPVEVIFRALADDESDPFTLRRETGKGIAGLIQAAREGNVDLANPVGSGFIDTPLLSLFLPVLCQRLFAEELLLAGHPSWWCGHPDGRAHVQANLEQLELFPALPHLHAGIAVDPLVGLRETPSAWLGRQPLQTSLAPVWEAGRVVSRPVLLRLFATADKNGFAVLPGGLAIVADEHRQLTGDAPERLRSKDIWVLSNEPVSPFSLLEGLDAVAELRRSSDLPSRVADHLLWLGRYLERAEGSIRLLRAVCRRLGTEERPGDLPELPFLLELLRARNPMVVGSAAEPEPTVAPGDWPDLLRQALYNPDHSESVLAVLRRVQGAARHVRDRLSLDCWRVLNRLELFSESAGNDPQEVLDDTLFTLSAFSGLAMESMTRGLGWRFMDMGRRLERAMNQTALLRISQAMVRGAVRSSLEALLEVADSSMTYRARYRTTFQLAPALDLLLIDESNPKSLAFQLAQLAAHVEELPRQGERRFASSEERLALEMLTATRLLDLGDPRSAGKPLEPPPLAHFLETMEENLKKFAQQVTAHYLSRVPTTPHFTMITSEAEHALPDRS